MLAPGRGEPGGMPMGGPLQPPSPPTPPPSDHNVTSRTVFAQHVPRLPDVGEADLTLPVPGKARPVRPSSPSEPGLDPSISYTAGVRPAEERYPTLPEGDAVTPQPATLPGQPVHGASAVAEPQWGPVTPSAPPTTPGANAARIVLVRRDGSEGEAFPLTGAELVVGRSRGTLTFPDDTFMSLMHARIERSGDRFTLVDVGSRNGVYLRIGGMASVYPGDLFMVGHQLLRLESVAHTAHESPPDADGTHEFGTPLQPAWGRLVLVGRGGVAGDTYHLRASEVVFGRESGDVVFPTDPFVSREHARLRLEIESSSMAVYLEDLGSANGTYIRIRGSVEVRPEDTFRVGDQILRLRVDT